MKKFFLTLVCSVVLLCCEKKETESSLGQDHLVHHQIIIQNTDALTGGFYLHSSAGHNYTLSPSDTLEIISGSFGTTLKNWDLINNPYYVMFYYIGSQFGCAEIEINTFVDFEFYNETSFVIGKLDDFTLCAWNGTSFQYPIFIE